MSVTGYDHHVLFQWRVKSMTGYVCDVTCYVHDR